MITKLESGLERWFKQLPHLSKSVRSWLAKYLWLFTLIGAVLAVAATVFLAYIIQEISKIQADLSLDSLNNTLFTPQLVIFGILTAIVAVSGIVWASAVWPLYHRRQLGWRILLIMNLVSAVLACLTLSIWWLLMAVVGLYVLFETRDSFHLSKHR